MPMRRKVDPAVAIMVAIDETAQRGERQIEAVDRMREQYRVALGRFDSPEIVEFDDVSVWFEQGRATDLACVMKSDWRLREIEHAAGRNVIVPSDFAILDSEVTDERDQESGSHCIHERWATLDRILFAHIDAVEGLHRHRLEPVGDT